MSDSDTVVVVEGDTASDTASTPPVVVVETDSGSDDSTDLAVGLTLGALATRVEALEAAVSSAGVQAESAQTAAEVALDVAIDAEAAVQDAAVESDLAADEVRDDTADALAGVAADVEDGASAEEALTAAAEEVRDEGPVSKPWTHKSARDWFGGKK